MRIYVGTILSQSVWADREHHVTVSIQYSTLSLS